ncbi:MAG: hypothetical protein NTU44_06430 [Bacteroidetes bacterium]|nr:hypothetical protein [Bacteroidota bacterium]
MAQKVTIGGEIIKQKGVEAIKDLQENRTMVLQKLTQNAPSKPEVVEGLKTVEDVFDHYKPSADVKFTDKEGGSVGEELKFNSLADFSLNGLTENSQFLQNLQTQSEVFQQILKELKGNNRLKKILAEPTGRKPS